MNHDPGARSTLQPGVVALAALAALIALSVAEGPVPTAEGRFVIAGAALLVVISSALAVLVGKSGLWFRGALAIAVICASAGVLVRSLPEQAQAPRAPAPDAGPLPAPDETARPAPEAPPPGPTPEWAEQVEEAARVAGASGNLAESVDLFEQAISARKRMGDPLKAAFTRVNLALSLVKLGRKDEARAVLSEALPVLDALPADHPARGTARAMAAELEGEAPAGSGENSGPR